MSGSSLSDRLKNVENELNDITSLMSVKESQSSQSRSTSDTSILMGRKSDKMSCNSSRLAQRAGNMKIARSIRSRSVTCSDTKVNDGFQSSKSSLGCTSSNESFENDVCRMDTKSNSCTSSRSRVKSNDVSSLKLQPSMCGDNLVLDYDKMKSYLDSMNNVVVKGNQTVTVLPKISDIVSKDVEVKPGSSPCSDYNNLSKRYRRLTKDQGERNDKLLSNERNFYHLKAELKKYKLECKKNRELYLQFSQINQQLEKENMDQIKQLKALENTNEETLMQMGMHKQKYEALLEDLKIDREQRWEQEREMTRMKECLDQTQLKIQELMGARTMAVELAHDLQKKHQTYAMEHQHKMQELKNKNLELEKLLNDAISEKNLTTERLHSLEINASNYNELLYELDDCKRNLSNAQKTIHDLTRNPEGIPQVKSMLDTQEQSFKAALTEKATNEMAMQAKYTTLEVELQIIQEEHSKRVNELEVEAKHLKDEYKWKTEELQSEINKLKLVIEELTELSNQYKARIAELSDINKHQEVLIKCQNEAISSKEERVRLTNQEGDLNMRRAEQERKTLVMEHEKAVANLNKLLEEERDNLRVKDKIADDQAESIMHLKQNLSDRVKELQKKTKDSQRLEHSLKQEKQEKDNLLCDVQHLKMLRSRMRDQINELKNKLDSLNTSAIHKKHSQMLEELEKKVVRKQTEWDSEISKLRTERDQARETAQYAIENLSSAMEEYQKEIVNQKSLQTGLASLIKQKEDQLNMADNKIKKLEQDKAFMEMVSIGDRKRYLSPEKVPKMPVFNMNMKLHKETCSLHNQYTAFPQNY